MADSLSEWQFHYVVEYWMEEWISQYIIIFSLYYVLLISSMHCQQQQDTIPTTLAQLNSQPYTSLTILKYNAKSSSWKPYHPSACQPQIVHQITTLTLNVLTDCIMQAPLKRNLLFSNQRYAYILHYLAQVSPSILTLNQVTRNFYDLLIASQWVQKDYWVSSFTHLQADGSFNVIMAKIEPILARSISLKGLARPVLTLYFALQDKKSKKKTVVSVSCAHLTSLTRNSGRRKQQLTELSQNLDSATRSLENKNLSHIVQGDLNIHSQEQNVVFHSLNWKDSWIVAHNDGGLINQAQVLKEHPGFTFDGEKNHLIKEVYWGFQARRMRLDRIVGSGGLACQNIKIVLNEPIYTAGKEIENYARMGWVKGAASFLGDLAGINLFRKSEEYLFPSDHFGLLAKFVIMA